MVCWIIRLLLVPACKSTSQIVVRVLILCWPVVMLFDKATCLDFFKEKYRDTPNILSVLYDRFAVLQLNNVEFCR